MGSSDSEVQSLATEILSSQNKARTFLRYYSTDNVRERKRLEAAINKKLGIDDLDQILSDFRTQQGENIRSAKRFLKKCIKKKEKKRNYNIGIAVAWVGLAGDLIGLIHFLINLNFTIKDEQGNQVVNLQPILELFFLVILVFAMICLYSGKNKTYEEIEIPQNLEVHLKEKNPEHEQKIPQKKESQDKNSNQEQTEPKESDLHLRKQI